MSSPEELLNDEIDPKDIRILARIYCSTQLGDAALKLASNENDHDAKRDYELWSAREALIDWGFEGDFKPEVLLGWATKQKAEDDKLKPISENTP